MKSRRVCWPERGKVVLEDFEVGPPGHGQVLIRTEWTLISPGTERAFLTGMPNATANYPTRPGYNSVGRVVDVGPDVKGVSEGDRVASSTGHAGATVVPAERTVRVPDGLSGEEAAFFCMGAISLQGVRKARVELGEPVLVIGQGIIGNLALQLARLSGGAPAMAADRFDERLAISMRCGADEAINPDSADLEERVRALTGAQGAAVVVEATGEPEAVLPAFRSAGRMGRVVLLASSRGETSPVNFYRDVHKKGLTVIGAHNSIRPDRDSTGGYWTFREDAEVVLKLMAAGRLKVRDLIRVRMKAEEAPKAYQTIVEERGGVPGFLLDWWG